MRLRLPFSSKPRFMSMIFSTISRKCLFSAAYYQILIICGCICLFRAYIPCIVFKMLVLVLIKFNKVTVSFLNYILHTKFYKPLCHFPKSNSSKTSNSTVDMNNQKLDQNNFSVNVKTHLFMYALANTGKCIRR